MDDPTWAHVVRACDRALFKRCRRAWDLGARSRQNLEPNPPPPPSLPDALNQALAVYYFPGMWAWSRSVVEPLVRQRFLEAVAGAPPDEVDSGLALLERYGNWAPDVDAFTPLRVVTDFELDVPDPAAPDRTLTAVDGRPIRFRGVVDLLVVDGDGAHWVVTHRLAVPGFAEPDLLRLDEAAVTSCWGWEHCYLGTTIAGTIHNELRLDGFRRTAISRSRAELAAAGERLAAEVRAMTDPEVVPWPHPTPAHCGPCPYRPPCLTLMAGEDPTFDLLEGYRVRGPELQEGRLGGATWSSGRGAAPPRFGRGPRR